MATVDKAFSDKVPFPTKLPEQKIRKEDEKKPEQQTLMVPKNLNNTAVAKTEVPKSRTLNNSLIVQHNKIENDPDYEKITDATKIRLDERFADEESVVGIINSNPHLRKELIEKILTDASAIRNRDGCFRSWDSIVAIISNYGNRIDKELMNKTVENLSIMLKKNEFFSDEESFVEMITKYSDFPKELIKEVFQKKMRPYNEYRKRSSWEIEAFWDNKLIKAILKNPVYNSYVIEPITAMLTKNSTIGEDEKFADEQSAVAMIEYYSNLPKDVIQEIFKTATHLKIEIPERKKLLGGHYDVNDEIVKAILGNETYASYIDQKAIATALTNASQLRKDGTTLVNMAAVKKILEKFPLESFDPFIVQALWANPGTSDHLLNYIFDYCKANNLLETLPPRNPSSRATAYNIHTAMRQYIDRIKNIVEVTLKKVRLLTYEEAIGTLYEKTKKYAEEEQLQCLGKCIAKMGQDNKWQGAFESILPHIVTFLAQKEEKIDTEEKKKEMWGDYLSASFVESFYAYDQGANTKDTISCVQGIYKRAWGGLKMVDKNIEAVFNELEGASLFRERLKSPETILNDFKMEDFEDLEKMMTGLVQHIRNEAITDYSLDLNKPYCLMNTNSGYCPYLTLKEEIHTLLNLEDYRNFFGEAFNQHKLQTENQITEPKQDL